MKKIMLLTLLALLPAFAHAGALTAHGTGQDYIGIVIGSRHIAPSNERAASLNDKTPGMSFGRRHQTQTSGIERFVEGGVFYNSYEEVSPFFIGGYTMRLTSIGGGQVRIGGFFGTGYYKELGETLNELYGLPSLGGFIPIAGATISYRYGRHELRLTTVPAENLGAIANLSYAISF